MESKVQFLEDYRHLIDRTLVAKLPARKTKPTRLHDAMRYGVLTGGKRLRPMMCMAACEAMGGQAADALIPAIAIEALHTYTLIHDDLPAMDDDDIRRGQPSCHKQFDEATAILAGDALLTLAFEWMAASHDIRLVAELARAAGSRGIIAGQMADVMEHPDEECDPASLTYIHRHKTADLFAASARIGGLCAPAAAAKDLQILTGYGRAFGLAFQIQDDVVDKDKDQQLTAVHVYGLAGAARAAQSAWRDAKRNARQLSGKSERLVALIDVCQVKVEA